MFWNAVLVLFWNFKVVWDHRCSVGFILIVEIVWDALLGVNFEIVWDALLGLLWILKLCEMFCWVYYELWNCVRCSVGFILNFEIVWDALLVLFWIFNLCDERRVRLDAWSTVKSHSWPKVQPQPLWSIFSGDASLDPFHPTSRRQCVKEEGMRQVN